MTQMNQTTIFETTESTPAGRRADENDRERLRQALAEIDVKLGSAPFERAFTRVQKTESRTGPVSEGQLRAIVDEVVTGSETLEGVAESFR